mgnify:CR=1 FL=1
MGATGDLVGGGGEPSGPGRGLTKSGKVADDDRPLGMGVCIDLIVFLVIEHRNRIAGKDHGHGQGHGHPETAFAFLEAFLCFVFGAHFGLPFVCFARFCRLANIFAGSVPISLFPRN